MDIDGSNQPLSSYLLKVLTVLVKKAGGELRISAIDMMDVDNGQGVVKYYDRDSHELVLRFTPAGSICYFTKPGDSKWTDLDGKTPLPLRPAEPQPPAQPSHLSTVPFSLDDQRLVDLEDQRLRERAAAAIANFPSAPVTEPGNRPINSPDRSLRREMFSR